MIKIGDLYTINILPIHNVSVDDMNLIEDIWAQDLSFNNEVEVEVAWLKREPQTWRLYEFSPDMKEALNALTDATAIDRAVFIGKPL